MNILFWSSCTAAWITWIVVHSDLFEPIRQYLSPYIVEPEGTEIALGNKWLHKLLRCPTCFHFWSTLLVVLCCPPISHAWGIWSYILAYTYILTIGRLIVLLIDIVNNE